ncbi:hypothetical protein CVT25_014025 [Psilocybe cyanescens]|uniref:RNA exonuclease 4 n=1 Tax=Psilocybe cyanescens TaxID=93625 RepID=A0A409XPP2_PSICY|nr:hypothetical protein CVT25_014025 [Psilocybe cyanescens]
MAPSTERFIAISCTVVGVGPGGTTNAWPSWIIAASQYSIDMFRPLQRQVTDYRTQQTANAMTFAAIQSYCSTFFRGKILVGHSLWNDLAVLGLPHPAIDTRDVALYLPFRNALRSPSQIIGLQTLSWQLMSRRCQEGQSHPVENARAALDLYRTDADAWEASISRGNWPCALPPSTFSRCYL